MSDTPRTDALANAYSMHALDFFELARELERENAALRADNQAAHALVIDLRAKEHSERTLAVKLEKENAALRADKERLDWMQTITGSEWAYRQLANNLGLTRYDIDVARKKEVQP